jgi:[protein-PII] uridylyltransferase
MGIVLHNAKITTLGENVEDVFFVTDKDNHKLLDPVLTEILQSTVRSRLDNETWP